MRVHEYRTRKSRRVSTRETLRSHYTYNNRLQPWMIRLGQSGGNLSSDYCLVYNYFSTWTAPSSCPDPSTVPTSGSGNNGNVRGYWYNDSVNSSFSHTASYTYDNVNRLSAACTLSGTQCATSGAFVYNLAFAYDQFGNMRCTGGVGGGSPIGPCPAWTYNTSNQLSTSVGFTYDAAGNVINDSVHTYQWDAEGHTSSIDSGTTANMTFNALGWRVYRTNGTRSYWVDPQGRFLGDMERRCPLRRADARELMLIRLFQQAPICWGQSWLGGLGSSACPASPYRSWTCARSRDRARFGTQP